MAEGAAAACLLDCHCEGNIKLFVCGPPGMMKAISGAKVSPKDQGELDGILKDLGYNKDQVYKF